MREHVTSDPDIEPRRRALEVLFRKVPDDQQVGKVAGGGAGIYAGFCLSFHLSFYSLKEKNGEMVQFFITLVYLIEVAVLMQNLDSKECQLTLWPDPRQLILE